MALAQIEEIEKNSTGKTALVTGGLGFIGFNLCTELFKRGYRVIALDNNQLERILEVRKQGDWEVYHMSILNHRFNENIDVIFHLAAISLPESFSHPDLCLDTATKGTLRMLELAQRENAFFIYLSSSEVYGDGQTPMAETNPLKPTTIYGAAKASGELITEAYAKLHNLRNRYLIIRPFNCYGPYHREDGHACVVTKFLISLIRGGEATIYGEGTQTRDFMYVKDTVDGIITAYEKRDKLALHPIVNLCTGHETSINALYTNCLEACSTEHIPMDSAKSLLVYTSPRQGDIESMVGNPWYAKSALGWQPKHTLEEGLRKYASWLAGKRQ